MEKKRKIAIDILNEFEELLDYHEIDIPDEDREGNPIEARLFGKNWYTLEDKITDILEKM